MRIYFGNDHAGVELKGSLMQIAKQLGHEVEDCGCFTKDSVDYPDYARPVCDAVVSGKAERGVLICNTGVGMSIAANKIDGIRCALCGDLISGRLSREHNDTNVLALGAGIIGKTMAEEIFTIWLSAEHAGGRHTRRVDKAMSFEK